MVNPQVVALAAPDERARRLWPAAAVLASDRTGIAPAWVGRGV
jgi:hypothetical protein